jgi:hypothetical protein
MRSLLYLTGRTPSPFPTEPEQGDAVPVQLNELHALENNGTAPLELLVFGVSRERNKEIQ